MQTLISPVVPLQSLSRVWLFLTPCIATHQASLCFTTSQSLFKLMSIESVMPLNHLILSSPSPPAFNLCQHQGLFHDLADALCIRWLKYWSFSFSICPSNEYSGLIFLRIDWFDLIIQETLKSLLQHHSLKVSILQCSAFFIGPTLTSLQDYLQNHSFD